MAISISPAARSVCLATGALVVMLTGCQSVGRANRPDPPDYASLREAQADRIAKLELFRAGGVIELNWRDDDGGSDFIQGDITILAALPTHLAFRVHKLGDTHMWFGSNESRFWIFDMSGDEESVAYVGAFADFDDSARVPGVVHPMRLLDLIGLAPLPDDAVVEYDEDEKAWRIDAVGRGGPIRMYFDRRDRPIRVDSLNADGEVMYRSRLANYMLVESPGRPPGAYPALPRTIDIREPGGDSWTVATLSSPTTDVDLSRIERACDLDRLLGSLLPDRVEKLEPVMTREPDGAP